MSKILKATLASVLLIAGSSMSFAAERDGRSPNVGNSQIGERSRSTEQQELLDYGTTGSIVQCESQMWDQNGNCVVDPGYDPDMR